MAEPHAAHLDPAHLSGTTQNAVLLVMRTAVVGTSLVLWWQGRATPGDVTYVLTTYFVVHGYLRDIGMHIHHLQRSVNEMEELVAIHDEPLGIEDRPDATPIRIDAGEIRFDRVTFRYGAHTVPLYQDLSVTIRAARARRSGRAVRARARRPSSS